MLRGQGASTACNIGVINDLDEHNHLLLALGRGLVNAEATDQSQVYLGYLRTW
jgi:hypothetical protein